MKKLFQYHKKSFAYAFEGLKTLFRSEHNMSIHLIATVLALALGWWKTLSPTKWAILVAVIALVWMAEAFNTALERLCDLVHKEYHPVVKQVKDISSAAVLITAIAAVITGLLLFFFP